MHALRNVHRMLAPDGVLLDLHPIPPHSRAEAGGADLGAFDDSEFHEKVIATEAGLAEAVRIGLFAPEARLELDVLERFERVRDVLDTIAEREDTRMPAELERRIRAAAPPIDLRHHVVLQRLRRF